MHATQGNSFYGLRLGSRSPRESLLSAGPLAGHSHLSTTGIYLQGISSEEITSTVHAQRAPMMHAHAGLAPLSTAGAHDALPRPAKRARPGVRRSLRT